MSGMSGKVVGVALILAGLWVLTKGMQRAGIG